MCKSPASQGKKHPHDIALAEALANALHTAKMEHPGFTDSWAATYVLGISAPTLHKYKSLDEPDTLPARLYPLVAKACQNNILLDALVAMHDLSDRAKVSIPSLTGLMAQRCGKAVNLILQAQAPDSPGGVVIDPAERKSVHQSLLYLEVVIREMIEETR